MDNTYKISFTAKPGAEVMRRVTQECNGDKVRIAKFKELFEDVFSKNLDENTVVDVDKQERFIFSNLNFPNIFYKSNQELDRGRGKDFSSSIIMACPKVLSSIEHKMIRTIIKKSVKSGKSLEEMEKMVEANIKNENIKKYFLDNLNIARRIMAKNPQSKLTLNEFEDMEMVIFNELAETSGTPEYKMLHEQVTLEYE